MIRMLLWRQYSISRAAAVNPWRRRSCRAISGRSWAFPTSSSTEAAKMLRASPKVSEQVHGPFYADPGSHLQGNILDGHRVSLKIRE